MGSHEKPRCSCSAATAPQGGAAAGVFTWLRRDSLLSYKLHRRFTKLHVRAPELGDPHPERDPNV